METRESLKNLLIAIVKDIGDGKDLGDITESLEEASGIAEEMSIAEESEND